ncbi:MAG: hypothetical protein V1895_01360 [Parcubacteria group bacterium]
MTMHSIEDILNMMATEAVEGPFCEGSCFGYHGIQDSREFKDEQRLHELGLDNPVSIPLKVLEKKVT